jgi:Ferritin-like domain
MNGGTDMTAALEAPAVEIAGTTRSAFLLKAALAAGTVYGLASVTPFISKAMAQEGMGDVDIVNFALTLEYLETDFYEQAQKLGLSSELKKLASQFGGAEAEHVDALTATVKQLGGMPAKKPTFQFPMKDEPSFLKLAVTLEDTGVAAYNGAGPSIKSKEVLGAAGSIVQVEARHAAAVRLANGQEPAPDAFDRTQTADQVMMAVKPLIKSA